MKKIVKAAFCAVLTLGVAMAVAQAPDTLLNSLSKEYQDWVLRSCPKSLGPSLWYSCVNREASALKGNLPDLSKLSDSDQTWVRKSCPSSLGPSLTISCINRELNAITRGIPKLEQLTSDKRSWVLQSCPQSLGPSLYKSCVERETRALTSGATQRFESNSSVTQAQPKASARTRGSRSSRYSIETSHNDELFIINGEKFEAKTYCFNMEEDDEIVFLDGSPFGACVSATLLNLRTRQKCDVWCE